MGTEFISYLPKHWLGTRGDMRGVPYGSDRIFYTKVMRPGLSFRKLTVAAVRPTRPMPYQTFPELVAGIQYLFKN